jgi:hypothetical protein
VGGMRRLSLAILMLFTLSARADDKYVMRIFSYDGVPGSKPFSADSWGHSFLAVTHLKTDADGNWVATDEIEHLSYLPESGVVDLKKNAPEKGLNFSLERTLGDAQRENRTIGMSDSWEIPEALYRAIKPHQSYLENEAQYFIFPKALKGEVRNCIWAIESWARRFNPDLPPFTPGINHGKPASELLLGWMQDSNVVSRVNDQNAKRIADEAFRTKLNLPENLIKLIPKDTKPSYTSNSPDKGSLVLRPQTHR